MREGDFPQAVRNSNIMAVTVDLPLVPATAIVLFDVDDRGKQVGTMDDGNGTGAGCSYVGIRFLYRRRDADHVRIRTDPNRPDR